MNRERKRKCMSRSPSNLHPKKNIPTFCRTEPVQETNAKFPNLLSKIIISKRWIIIIIQTCAINVFVLTANWKYSGKAIVVSLAFVAFLTYYGKRLRIISFQRVTTISFAPEVCIRFYAYLKWTRSVDSC